MGTRETKTVYWEKNMSNILKIGHNTLIHQVLDQIYIHHEVFASNPQKLY
jgi:hypothetical protein